eukprot:Transcript_5263.p1 GENE.Transcript_5263~~Transcript_5263.p1  ORF type:complete len:219 (-),score=83.51 Transcript_5263:60-716(-)
MATDPLLLIQDLITTLSGRRPVVVALLVIAICFVLLRPRRKPQRPSSTQGAGSSSNAAAAPKQKLPALSLSTRDILLEFANGSPQLKQVALEPLFRLCSRHQVFLVTQLPVDSDELEAAVVALLEGAGVFAEGRCERRKAMFCCTEAGRGAMCRQLGPAVHIDTSAQVVQYLAPLPDGPQQLVFVSAAGDSLQPAKGTVVSVASLAAYASLPARGTEA